MTDMRPEMLATAEKISRMVISGEIPIHRAKRFVAKKPTGGEARTYMIELGASGGQPTARCFRGPAYSHRSDSLDRDLPLMQSARSANSITTYYPTEELNPFDLAAMVLGVSDEMPPDELAKLLVEHDHVLMLPAIEKLLDMYDKDWKGDLVHLAADSEFSSNQCFVVNATGGVLLMQFHRPHKGAGWTVQLNSFNKVYGISSHMSRQTFVFRNAPVLC